MENEILYETEKAKITQDNMNIEVANHYPILKENEKKIAKKNIEEELYKIFVKYLPQ